VILHEEKNELKPAQYNLSQLQPFVGDDGVIPQERLSTGTRFALREWVAIK